MTRFERWFLRKLLRKQVRQGYTHDKRITELYREIHDAAKREFYEDNVYTRNEYLREWFENSLDKTPLS
jgi:hypothetical protein